MRSSKKSLLAPARRALWEGASMHKQAGGWLWGRWGAQKNCIGLTQAFASLGGDRCSSADKEAQVDVAIRKLRGWLGFVVTSQ